MLGAARTTVIAIARRVCAFAVLIATLAACGAGVPDRRGDADTVTAEIGRMAGVISATNDFADDPAQGVVHFWLHAEVSANSTEEQLAAVTDHYLSAADDGLFAGYRLELEVNRGRNVFRVDSGNLPIANRDQVIRQARSWVALQRDFPGSTIRLRATIVHPQGEQPIQDLGHSNAAILDLPDWANYQAVSSAAQQLAVQFPDLAGLNWNINAGKQHPAELSTSLRLPDPAEIGVWNRLNADQSIAHIDRLVINGPATPPVWFSEKTTHSHDVAVAVKLARRHLPVVAELPAPVLYSASDQLSGHVGARGTARGPISVTVGGCTHHDPAVYTPIDEEQELIETYETCPQ